MENQLDMNTNKKSTITEKAKTLINWSALSEQMAHNRDSIRSERIPLKYQDDVNILLSYVEAWLNCKELTTKESLIGEIEFIVGDKITNLSKELLKFGKNPFKEL